MYVYAHTHTHTQQKYSHICMCKFTHTDIHTRIHTYIHTRHSVVRENSASWPHALSLYMYSQYVYVYCVHTNIHTYNVYVYCVHTNIHIYTHPSLRRGREFFMVASTLTCMCVVHFLGINQWSFFLLMQTAYIWVIITARVCVFCSFLAVYIYIYIYKNMHVHTRTLMQKKQKTAAKDTKPVYAHEARKRICICMCICTRSLFMHRSM